MWSVELAFSIVSITMVFANSGRMFQDGNPSDMDVLVKCTGRTQKPKQNDFSTALDWK